MANDLKIAAALDADLALIMPALITRAAYQKVRRAIDGGAHRGLFATRIVPFVQAIELWEPNSACWPELQALEHTHPEIFSLRPYALGNTHCNVTLRNPEEKERSYYYGEDRDGQSEMRMLDASGRYDVDLIKLNIEGAELLALQGAIKTIRATWPILLLEDKGYGRRFGYTSDELKAFLADLRYVNHGRARHMYLYLHE